MKARTSKSLLSILVEYLPTIGGWPRGVEAICQNAKGRLIFLTHGYEIVYNPDLGWAGKAGESIPDVDSRGECIADLARDYDTAIIKKYRWDNAMVESGWHFTYDGGRPKAADADDFVQFIDIKQRWMKGYARDIDWPNVVMWRVITHAPARKEWDGTGLPAVGEICMVKTGRDTRVKCEILYSDAVVGLAFKYLDADYKQSIDCINARNAADYFTVIPDIKTQAIEALMTLTGYEDDARELYEAIEAGKIPGIRLDN